MHTVLSLCQALKPFSHIAVFLAKPLHVCAWQQPAAGGHKVSKIASCLQVAKLQGLSDTAANQFAAASASAVSNGDASVAEQWMKQQADSLAAQPALSGGNDMPAWQLAFLPDVMTRAAAGHQLDAPTAAAAAHTDTGSTAVQANQQETAQRGCTAPETSVVEGSEQHMAPANAAVPIEPVSWLQWEQHLQVTFNQCVVYTWVKV